MLAVAGTAGCAVSVDYGDGSFRCDSEPMTCPSGTSCVDGVCLEPSDPPTAFLRRLTVDPSFGAALADVPVMIQLDPTRVQYAAAGATGENLEFRSVDGATLEHEVESWDPAGVSIVWLLVPMLDGGTVIEMHYGEGASGGTGPVFGAYEAVFHFTGDVEDSGPAGLLGTPNNGALEGEGRIGNACVLDGIDDYLLAGEDIPAFRAVSQLTISAWVRTEVAGSSVVEVTSGDLAAPATRAFLGHSSNHEVRLGIRSFDGSGPSVAVTSGVVETLGDWHWLVGTADLAAGVVSLYVDGELRIETLGLVFDPIVTADTNAPQVIIGRDDTSENGYVQGAVDEVRWRSSTVDAAWVTGQYRSMSDSLLEFGAEEPQ